MKLDNYIRQYETLATKRKAYPSGGYDWEYYTSQIDDLLYEAQDTLAEDEFDKLLTYV